MSRKFGIFLIFIALLPLLLVIFYPSPDVSSPEFSVSYENKQHLLSYAYSVLDSYFQNDATNSNHELKIVNEQMNYDVLFITLLCDGMVRGCQSGSHSKDSSDRLFLDIEEATIESIKDSRFGGELTKDEWSNTTIMFTFLYNTTLLDNTSSVFLQSNIELGVHALGIIHNNTPTIFKESVPIVNNYDLDHTLNRLCLKADLNNECIHSDDVDLLRYDTLTFYGEWEKEVKTLYRYNNLIDLDEISSTSINQSISLGYNWFLQSVNDDTGLLEYLYYPSNEQYSKDNNHVRQLASLWALTETQRHLNSSLANDLISTMLDYYLDFQYETETYAYLGIDNESKLGYNAFIILSLLNYPDYPNQQQLLDEFARGILFLQNENGSLNTYFFSEKNTGQDFYPGEALLSLMKLYGVTGNESYLRTVESAFPYYSQYWRSNKNTAFIPWHTQTYALLFEQTKNRNLSDFIFEMNDWMIDNYQMKTSLYPDEIGGFPKYFPTFSTSVFIEGVNDAYAVAKLVNDAEHVQKYKHSIKIGTQFILQTQFTENNSFYLEEPHRAIGGFKTSLTDNFIRIDNTQHALFALIKTMENKIFQ